MPEKTEKILLSASRRTDIPAFYMEWFMDGIRRGCFDVKNPYNQKIFRVESGPDRVDTIVFWSKNFSRFLAGGYGKTLREMGYHLYFEFTINSESAYLEPKVPSLSDRLAQAKDLCGRFGAGAVCWRFDPISFFALPDGRISSNLNQFEQIAGTLADCGIRRCITSFLDFYAKIERRPKPYPGFFFVDPSLDEKVKILLQMEAVLNPRGIRLYTCCENRVLSAMPESSSISAGACIDGPYLKEIFKGDISLKHDAGQRAAKGCTCTTSKDIGLYSRQPCFHSCLFCYANPAADQKEGSRAHRIGQARQ